MRVPSPLSSMLYFQMVIMAGTVMLAYYFEYTDTFAVNVQGFFCYEGAYRKPYPGPEDSSAVPPVLLYSLTAGVPVLVVSPGRRRDGGDLPGGDAGGRGAPGRAGGPGGAPSPGRCRPPGSAFIFSARLCKGPAGCCQPRRVQPPSKRAAVAGTGTTRGSPAAGSRRVVFHPALIKNNNPLPVCLFVYFESRLTCERSKEQFCSIWSFPCVTETDGGAN